MDLNLLPALITAAPQTALLGYLVFLLKHVMGQGTVDRTDYRADMDAAEKRHAEEISRLREAHAADLAALRSELTDLRGRVVELTGELDDERRRRWRAEDVAAEARRLAAEAVDAAPHTPDPVTPS